MAWTGLTLTVDGRNVLNKAQLNNKLNFKSVVIGDGSPPNNFGTQTSLVHQLFEITDLKIDVDGGGCILTVDLPKVDYDYYFREIGVIATTDDGEKLYVYDNCGEDAQFIVSTTGVEATEKRLRLLLLIDGVEEITVTSPSTLYVDYTDFENHTTDKTMHVTSSEKETWNTVTNKVDKEDGKGLSSNDYTNAEKIKLAGIAAGAQANTITGVKGNAESSYRTGNVNLTPANIGALPSSYVVYNNTTTVAGYALDARQANPNIAGSLGAQIKAENTALATHKTSGDHDGRYYTETEVKQLFNSFLTVATKQSSDYTLNPGGTATMTVSCAVSGYTPIGIIGFNCNGTSESYCNIYRCILSGTTCAMQVKNTHQSNNAVVKANFHVLYRKNM